MVNYRVEDLDALLQALRDEGCNVLEKTDDSGYGTFGCVMDPEGNKGELWQPPPEECAPPQTQHTHNAIIRKPHTGVQPTLIPTGYLH